VLGSAPESLITAAGELRAAASELDMQIASGRFHLATLEAQWTGTAAERAQTNADEMIGDQVSYRAKLKSLETELHESGSTLTDVRRKLSDLVNSGEASFFNIADNGSVTPGLRLLWWASLWPTNAMEVKIGQLKLQTKIQTALDEFDAADQAAAAALRKIDRG
jgi:uncharacterized protein YukE